jgi:hypothetical protein
MSIRYDATVRRYLESCSRAQFSVSKCPLQAAAAAQVALFHVQSCSGADFSALTARPQQWRGTGSSRPKGSCAQVPAAAPPAERPQRRMHTSTRPTGSPTPALTATLQVLALSGVCTMFRRALLLRSLVLPRPPQGAPSLRCPPSSGQEDGWVGGEGRCHVQFPNALDVSESSVLRAKLDWCESKAVLKAPALNS